MSWIRSLLLRRGNPLAFMLLATLAMRVAVPAGWMPVADGDGFTRIAICTGMGAQDVWLDAKGGVHKSDPGEQQRGESPCLFAGLGTALDVPQTFAPPLPLAAASDGARQSPFAVAIGRGLAAPPPPATGPPALY